jgi:hypothetical protein
MAGLLHPYRSFTSDKITVLSDDSSDNDSVESGFAGAESETDYAQDESEPAEEEEDNIEPVTVTAPDSDAQWVWCDINAGYRVQKIPFSGQHGPQKHFDSVLDTFLMFFEEEIIILIVQETNRYVEKFIQAAL